MIYTDIKLMQPFDVTTSEYARFLKFPGGDPIYLPTERVVSKPEFVVPKTARYYLTDLYLLEKARKPNQFVDLFSSHEEMLAARCPWSADKDSDSFDVVDYHELGALGDDFRGTAHHPDVFLVEMWGDTGDDGHVRYKLLSYQFVNGWRFFAAYRADDGCLHKSYERESQLAPFVDLYHR